MKKRAIINEIRQAIVPIRKLVFKVPVTAPKIPPEIAPIPKVKF